MLSVGFDYFMGNFDLEKFKNEQKKRDEGISACNILELIDHNYVGR
jgi:hypothetical protein